MSSVVDSSRRSRSWPGTLRRAEVVLDEARGAAQEDREHAGRDGSSVRRHRRAGRDRRRTSPTTSWEVGPEGFADEHAVQSPAAIARPSADGRRRGVRPRPGGPARRRPRRAGIPSSPGGGAPTAAAERAWSASSRRRRRSSCGREAGGPVGPLLEQHRDLGGLGLREEVVIHPGVRRQRAGRDEVVVQQRRPDDQPSGDVLSRSRTGRTAAAARRASSGRGGVTGRTAARRPRPAPQRQRACAASRWDARTSRCR